MSAYPTRVRPQPSRLGSGSNPGTPAPTGGYHNGASASSGPVNYAQLQPSNSRTPYGNPGNPPARPTNYQQYSQTPAAPQPQTYLHPVPSGSYPAGEYPLQAYPPNQRTASLQAPCNNAMNTTYPSRLRTGVSVMVQPEKLTGGYQERLAYEAGRLDPEIEVASGTGASTPTPGTPLTSTGRLSRLATSSSRRNRNGMVNYAEGNSDDEFDFEDDSGSDGDFPAAAAPRRGRPPKYGRPGDGTPSMTPQQKEAMRQARRKAELEKGWSWLGERAPAERVVGVAKRKTMHVYHHEDELAEEAEKPELLVPITVELVVDGYRIRDAFLWNLNESLHTPETFAKIFCDDLSIPIVPYAEQVADMVRGQIEENQGLAEIEVIPDVGAEVTADDVAVFDGGEVLEPEKLKRKAQESDCRIIINLDVQIYMYNLRDKIEWDLTSALPPAVFAKQYCTELGLSGEALPLITHAIHEELLKHKKDALELGVLGGGEDENAKRKRGARRMEGVWRDWWEREEFGPVLVEMDIYEMEKREQEKARTSRRIKRTLPMGKKRR